MWKLNKEKFINLCEKYKMEKNIGSYINGDDYNEN